MKPIQVINKLNESTWEEKCRYIFNKYRDEFDTINEVRDISDYLNKLYDEGGMEAVNGWFLPSASDEYKKDFKSLINENKLKENYENGKTEPGVYQCNDCGKDFEEPGEGYSCPYCGCGDIIEPSFEDSCDYLGIKTLSPFYYVNGVPESCKTIEDADKYYDSLPDGSPVNYSNDKHDLTQEQYEFLNSHRKEVEEELLSFSRRMADSGPLD